MKRLVRELIQLRGRIAFAGESLNQRNWEVQQLREEEQKRAECFKSLWLKCALRVEGAASSLEVLQRELRPQHREVRRKRKCRQRKKSYRSRVKAPWSRAKSGMGGTRTR